MKYTRILVLLEFEDGTIRQVLSTNEQKELALRTLVDKKTGDLKVHEGIEPITFEGK